MENNFKPIFIVGTPRSGTTFLSALLDRHSKISIPPETQFFTEFAPQVAPLVENASAAEVVELALKHERIRDLDLKEEEVLERYLKYNKTLPNLLRAILEAYSMRKNKEIPGEKSPKHIEFVPQILDAFPHAKIICIMRDGRDVVNSLLNVKWAEPGNPRRFRLFCIEWREHADLAKEYEKNLPDGQFFLIKYETILSSPEKSLSAICDFLGESYEADMLNHLSGTNVVPSWEKDWKEKASSPLDKNRMYAWRKSSDKDHIWAINSMIGKKMKEMGYPDTDLKDCPIVKKMLLYLAKIPYLKQVRPLSLLGLKLLRNVKIIS